MVKVVKFGGSSLASAEQFKKVGNIIRADEDRKYVVPSAPGKRFPEDTKVTDMLYKCYAEAEAGKNIEKSLKAIEERYNEIIKGLGLKLSLKEQFQSQGFQMFDGGKSAFVGFQGHLVVCTLGRAGRSTKCAQKPSLHSKKA